MLRMLLGLSFFIMPTKASPDTYLSSGEVAAISGGVVASAGLGLWLADMDSNRTALIDGPLPTERWLQKLIGGRFEVGKNNFLSGSLGSAGTPVACGILLAGVDATWPRAEKGKYVAQDLFLYTSGLIATMGVTNIFKGAFARPRPYIHFGTDARRFALTQDYAHNHNSFFSGHTSAAFFAATFLNMRVRSTMRRELTSSEYHDWRWASPAVLYSWAAFVGWSRIHSYDHYFSDVLVGALAGYFLAELFYSFGDSGDNKSAESGGAQSIVVFTYSF
jgi:membrane-associated phospholipid phosphatase